jgi:hypothetical protein
MAVSGEIKGDKELGIKIEYTNAGKGPALHVTQAFGVGPAPDIFIDDHEAISAGLNHTCERISLDKEGPIIFPNPTKQLWFETVIPRKRISPDVISGGSALVLQGCFAYETMNEVRHTWFCYVVYRHSTFATLTSTVSCKDGNGAN